MDLYILRIGPRGGFRGTSNNCVGEQKTSNYVLRKTKLKETFALQQCSTYLNPPLEKLVCE